MGKNERNARKSSLIKNVLSCGRIHGFKYLLDEKVTTYEKIFWMIVILSAFVGAALHMRTIWITYETNLMRTTIISTYYKYANIPFPSVTVCDSSRVDWLRVQELQLSDILKNSENLTDYDQTKLRLDLRKLLAALSIAQFGAPKDLNHVKNAYSSRKLDNLLISALLRKENTELTEKVESPVGLQYSCLLSEDNQNYSIPAFISWSALDHLRVSPRQPRTKIFGRTNILHKLSLDYGINDDKVQWTDWNNQIRPRRTAGHGPWTGLRFSVKSQKIPAWVKIKSGIVVIIGDPSGFPFENDLFIPKGKSCNIGVWGDAVITTNRLQKLSISKRRCLFPNEGRILHRGYLRQNCIADCYRMFVQSHCKCSLDFIYYQIQTINGIPGTKYPPCQLKHLQCLAEYNYAFNNHLNEESIMYAMSSKEASFCDCPDDCRNQKYIAKLKVHHSDTTDNVTCDVHFKRSFGTLYQTDIAFDYIDALVSYGSIAGLFLGASLLSVTEIVYFIASNLINMLYSSRPKVNFKKFSIPDMAVFYRTDYPRTR